MFATSGGCKAGLQPPEVARGMARKETRVAVVTADIIGSTRYSRPDRRRVDRLLHVAFREVQRRYPRATHTPLSFRITAVMNSSGSSRMLRAPTRC